MEKKYLQLYKKLRDEILNGVYKNGEKLPSKRLLSAKHNISVITVDHAITLLIEEGYIESKERSGYFVIYKKQDSFSIPAKSPIILEKVHFNSNTSFPFSSYAKTMRKVISDYGENLLIKSPNKGSLQFRKILSSYLARARGIFANEEQIIIGSGAEYLYGLLVHILGRNLKYGLEKPSYEKIEQVYLANDVCCRHLLLGNDGIKSTELMNSDADVLHISPYRSYPSGIKASASKRQEYLRWMQQKEGRYIIEDDFESEFTPSTKAEETLFALSNGGNVIYLNTFSKTIAPSIRIGYMVLPKNLLSVYEERAGFYSCSVPAFEQYVLAEFIANGDFERHINRVRRQNRKKQKDL